MTERRPPDSRSTDSSRSARQGLLHALMEAAPMGLLLIDRQGAIRFANPEIERLFGYTQDELLRQAVESLLPQALRSAHAEQRAGFDHHPSERPMGAGRDLFGRHKDGTVIPLEIGLKAVATEEGPLVLATVVDITARKEAERAIRERDERFRQLAENIDEVFYVMDAHQPNTLYVNPAYEAVWGRSIQSVYDDPSSFLDGVPAADRDRVGAYMAEVQRGADPGTIEFAVVRPDGEARQVLAHAAPVRNEQGEVYRLAGVALDITERRRAQAALRVTEQRLLALFETVDLIVLGLDRSGRIDYANPYFLQLTGYSREEAFGSSWFEQFLPAASRAQLQGVFSELLERGVPGRYRNAIVTRRGEERMVSWHNTLVRDAQGQPSGTLSIGEDITQYENLEKQFRQAQKMEAVGRLAGGVAHDFNNVLTVIAGCSDLLASTFEPADDRRSDIEVIQQAVGSAATLTRQLLAFSRKQVLQPRVLDLNDVVRSAQKMLRRTIGEDIELVTQLAEDLAPVRVDAGQIEQVLMNLAVNSRDALPQGGRITIRTANVDVAERSAPKRLPTPPGSYALLAVSDSGVGMDEVTKSRIFEPFFTTKEAGRGTGLGLSTVYGIVKQSQGYVAVESELGAGTTFKIYLPRVDADAEARADEAGTAPQGGTETILLVEDEPAVRKVAYRVLRGAGYTVLDAPDGATALAVALEYPGVIHLLATDVVMPGINGRQLAEQLRAVRSDLAVLFMSGYTDDAVTRAGLTDRNLHYLQKPYTLDRLVRKVREVLDVSIVA